MLWVTAVPQGLGQCECPGDIREMDELALLQGDRPPASEAGAATDAPSQQVAALRLSLCELDPELCSLCSVTWPSLSGCF